MDVKRRWLLLLVAVVLLASVVASHSGYIRGAAGTVITLPGWLVAVDYVRGYDYSRTPDWWYLTVPVVSWVFWAAVVWPFVHGGEGYRRLPVIVAVLAVLPIAYLAFRTTRYERDNGEIYGYHRSWGFVTRVTLDVNRDGQVDEEYWYSWREPFLNAHTSEPQRSRSDGNLDGQWDTWIDYSSSQLQIDTDGDGAADRTLVADHDGFEEAKRMRGY